MKYILIATIVIFLASCDSKNSAKESKINKQINSLKINNKKVGGIGEDELQNKNLVATIKNITILKIDTDEKSNGYDTGTNIEDIIPLKTVENRKVFLEYSRNLEDIIDYIIIKNIETNASQKVYYDNIISEIIELKHQNRYLLKIKYKKDAKNGIIFITFHHIRNRYSEDSKNIYKIAVSKECINCDLKGVYLCGAKLDGIKFDRSDMESLVVKDSIIKNSSFKHTNLKEASFNKTKISNTDFEYSLLDNVNFFNKHIIRSNFKKSSMLGVNLKNSTLEYCDMRQVTLKNSNLEGSKILYSNLKDANLEHANLEHANLDYSKLEGANFSYARWFDGKSCIKDSIGECKK